MAIRYGGRGFGHYARVTYNIDYSTWFVGSLVLEAGSDGYLLEDGTGVLLLEGS